MTVRDNVEPAIINNRLLYYVVIFKPSKGKIYKGSAEVIYKTENKNILRVFCTQNKLFRMQLALKLTSLQLPIISTVEPGAAINVSH